MTTPQVAQTAPVTRARTRARVEGGVRASTPRQIIFYILVGLFIIFCLAPFLWTLNTSLKGPNTIFHVPIYYLPNPISFANYDKIFHLSRFTHSLLNSFIVASCATVISLLIGSVCAYALARLHFPGKNIILALVLAIAMFPGIAIIGPLYRQFSSWNLINNYFALILPNVTFTLPLCIWTLNAFFRDLPLELEESARVDGCTRMQTLVKIVAPLAAPGIFTAAILLFIQAWNEYLFARTFMTKESRLTATVAIAQFTGADVSSQFPWGQITAASIVITLPLVIVVLLFQRRIISGLTSGAVKG
jgi:multiple sugar transport system permease protein